MSDPYVAALEARYGPAPTWRRFRPVREATTTRPRRAPSPRVRAVLARWASESRGYVDELPF
jgi:hypothetical protein